MTDWYRRTEWNGEIAADFEARLTRARPDRRGQYLSLQGYSLLAADPSAAETLLERAATSGEASEVPRAACYLALSRLAQGKVDGAIQAYDLAIAAERRNPAFRSTAGVDQALLIALNGRTDLFAHALDQLAIAIDDDWSLAGLEALAAESLIRNARGETGQARELAQKALGEFPIDAPGAEWGGISLDDLRVRLEEIAA